MVPMDRRIYWVDFAKSFGVFLVFWGHTLLYGGGQFGNDVNKIIYSFHMPMFFILSGYVAKPESTPFRQFVKKRFARVLLPALILYIITLPLYFISNWSNISLTSFFVDFFYVRGVCAYNRPVWFFICLFQLLLLVKILDLTNAKTSKLIVFCISCLILSYIMYVFRIKFFNLLGLNKSIIGLFFYIFGMLLRRTNYDKGRNSFIFSICALPIWILSGVILNPKVSMHNVFLGNYWLFITSGISGSIVFFTICKLFEKIAFIREYAKWTIFIICSHYILVSFLHIISANYPFVNTYVYAILSCCFVTVSLIIYKPICIWLEKHFPYVIGK